MTLLNTWNTYTPLALSTGLDIGNLSLAGCGDPWIGLGVGTGTIREPYAAANPPSSTMSPACFFSPFRLFQKGGMNVPDTADKCSVGAVGPKYRSERLDLIINELLMVLREQIDELRNDDEDRVIAGTSEVFWKGMGDLMLDRVVQDLSHKDPDVRWVAVKILGWMEHVRSIPPLVRALDDLDSAVRAAAEDTLWGRFIYKESGAVRNIFAVLGDLGNAQIAEIRTGRPGTQHAPYGEHNDPIDYLMLSLTENEDAVAGHVLAAIGEPAVRRLAQGLSHGHWDHADDAKVRSRAATVLGQMRHADGVFPLLAALAEENTVAVKKEAVIALDACLQAARREGKTEQAIEYCDRVLAHSTSDPKAYFLRRTLHRLIDDEEEAYDNLLQTIAFEPAVQERESLIKNTPGLYLRVALEKIREGGLEEALDLLVEASSDSIPDESPLTPDDFQELRLVRDAMESMHTMIREGSVDPRHPTPVDITLSLTRLARDLMRREAKRLAGGFSRPEDAALLGIMASLAELAFSLELARTGKTRDSRGAS